MDAINSGGMVSSEMRMARYVVPQIRQTAIQARYARRVGAWVSALSLCSLKPFARRRSARLSAERTTLA
jgi:hypothetical protein